MNLIFPDYSNELNLQLWVIQRIDQPELTVLIMSLSAQPNKITNYFIHTVNLF